MGGDIIKRIKLYVKNFKVYATLNNKPATNRELQVDGLWDKYNNLIYFYGKVNSCYLPKDVPNMTDNAYKFIQSCVRDILVDGKYRNEEWKRKRIEYLKMHSNI